MGLFLTVANSFAFVFAYILIIKNQVINKYSTIISLTCAVFAVEFIFNYFFIEYEKFALYLEAIIIAIVIQQKQKDFLKSFNFSFSALCCLSIFINVLANIIYFTVPIKNLYYNTAYNIFMQISAIIFGLVMNKKNVIDFVNPQSEDSVKFSLIYNISFIIFLSHIMGSIYVYIGLEMYYFVSVVAICLNTFTQIFLIIINKRDATLIIREKELEYLKNNTEIIEGKYSEIITLKSKTRNIINRAVDLMQERDNDGLLDYFTGEVSAAYINLNYEEATMQQVNLIREPLIRVLIQEFLNSFSEKSEIEFTLDIKANDYLAEINKIEVHKAIKLFLKTASRELMLLDQGMVVVNIRGNSKTFYFSIVSSLGSKQTNQMVSKCKEYADLKVLLQRNPNVINFHVFSDSIFLCQEIEVKNNE